MTSKPTIPYQTGAKPPHNAAMNSLGVVLPKLDENSKTIKQDYR